jgi:cytochrome c oxidase subunit 2
MLKEAKKGRPAAPDLLAAKGCLVCHSVDGTRKIGPSLKGIFRRKVTVLTGGKERELVADEEYLRRSITQPQADIVKGFPPVMPPQKDNITPDELNTIIEYLEDLK